MRYWKWVLLTTVLALAGLIVGLSRLARHQKHGPGQIDKDAGASTQLLASTDADAGTALAQHLLEPREVPSGSDAHVPPLPSNGAQ